MNLSRKIRRYILLLTLLVFIAVEVPIIATGYTTKPTPGDTIIVLGAKLIGHDPSTMLRLRLDETLKLYNEGYAQTIIVSGGKGADEEYSEAQVMRDYLVEHGIPAPTILLEDQSFNTYQNLVNSQKLMREHQLKKAIIVSNASHIRRALVLAQSLGLDASGSPAPMANNSFLTAKQYIREGAAMLVLAFFPRKF